MESGTSFLRPGDMETGRPGDRGTKELSPSPCLPTSRPLCHRWLPVLAWIALIFAGSSRSNLPTHPNDGVDTVAKKAIHVIEYGVLATLLWRALVQRKGSTKDTLTLKVLIGSLLYALSDELHQRFIPGRCGSLTDIGLDAVGVLIALALLRRWGWPANSEGPAATRSGG